MKFADIFLTIQGEAQYSGLPTIFIRTAYCPFACAWPCDTGFTKEKHWIDVRYEMSPLEVIHYLKERGWKTRYVCVTGGEPLVDKDMAELLLNLLEAGYDTVVETSGLVPVERFLSTARLILDIKTPSSGESDKNRYLDWDLLRRGTDQLKAVIQDRLDYDFVRSVVAAHRPKCEVLLSPMWVPGSGPAIAKDLAQWMLEDQFQARLQLQLHKIIEVK